MDNFFLNLNEQLEKDNDLLQSQNIKPSRIIIDISKQCRKCKSCNLTFTKHIGYGNKMGKVYHYKAHCSNCGLSYFVKRTKEIFEKVKDEDWIQSKSFKRYNY